MAPDPKLSAPEHSQKKGKKRKLPQNGSHGDSNSGGKSGAKKKAKNGKSNSHSNSQSHSQPQSPRRMYGGFLHHGSVSKANLDAVFRRVAERRRKEVADLHPSFMENLVEELPGITGTELPSLAAKASSGDSVTASPNSKIRIKQKEIAKDVRTILLEHYQIISDKTALPDKRRLAWEIVNEIFLLIDTMIGIVDDEDMNEGEPSQAHGHAHAQPAKPIGVAATGARKVSTTLEDGGVTGNAATNTSALSAAANKASGNATASSSKPSPPVAKKHPVRTVASLSSASAMTTATAADSKTPTQNDKHMDPTVLASMNHGAATTPSPPARAAVPEGAVPPAYQKRSLAAQQHKSQKLQKQQQQQTLGRSRSNSTSNNATTNANAKSSSAKSARTSPSSSSSTGISAGAAAAINAKAVRSSPSAAAAVVSASSGSNSSTSSSSSNTHHPAPSRQGKILNVTFDSSIPEPKEKPIDKGAIARMTLMNDTSPSKPTKYGCLVEDRPHVELQCKQLELTENMTKIFHKRLNKWEPFWVPEKTFCTGLTGPVMFTKYADNAKAPKYSPQTGARFKIQDLTKIAGPRIRQVAYNQAPKDNEYRVLIRMLPLYLSRQKNGGKHRADVHLWPKGTYMQIGLKPGRGNAVNELSQRKQQTHDATKWLGICKHLDITSQVHQVWASTDTALTASNSHAMIEFGCYDPELYMFSLALCRYRSPQALSQLLLQPPSISSREPPMLKRASLDEMKRRAKKLMASNEVILDGDSDEDEASSTKKQNTQELRSIRFSIRDPLTHAALKTPVRGRNCLHISCFELGSFLNLNISASGQRWKCGHCENFLSYMDLEHCALTEKAAKEYGDKITGLQHLVEFKEDGSMAFCKPARSHQERAQAKKLAAAAAEDPAAGTGPAAPSGGGQEIVELLDSDSD